MDNRIAKALLCLLVIGAVFAVIGCAAPAAERDDRSAPTPSPSPTSPAPAATVTPGPSSVPQPTQGPASPSPSAPSAGDGNRTTDLGLDDVFFSGGDAEYSYPEDALPTPEMPS